MRILSALFLSFVLTGIFAQQNLSPLTIEKIMQDPRWMGTSPTGPQWTADGKFLFFRWNPNGAAADSLYYISLQNTTPQKAAATRVSETVFYNEAVFNKSRTAYTYSKWGDVFVASLKDGAVRRITQTAETESNPQFGFGDNRIIYRLDMNLFSFDLATGLTTQLTNFKRGTAPAKEEESNSAQEKWLAADQLQTFEVLRQRKEKREKTDSFNRLMQPKELRSLYIESKMLQSVSISPTGRFVTYRMYKLPQGVKSTIVPAYVTESGFTTDLNTRTKVGGLQGTSEFFVYDRERDSVYPVKTNMLPGITDEPDYVKDYPVKDTGKTKKLQPRPVDIDGPYWNESGTAAFVEISAGDNKDRWIALLDAASGKLISVDRQRDEAWIGGPGIYTGNRATYWINEHTFWFQSEKTGYSHLYTYSFLDSSKKALTSGLFEVQNVQLSADKKTFYLSTNEVHPGEQHLYKMAVTGGRRERLTGMTGGNSATISPDEKWFANLYSYSNKPAELYLQNTSAAATAKQITFKAQSDAFKAYPWRDPKVFTITARDGQPIYARLYKPAKQNAAKAAVIFVHGAGYLQNAHKWWSTYFREYMFNNLLADNGYTVLDIDYRGSAGYGRDWRTGIYRYMGGKDLDDEMDAVQYLIDSLNVDAKHIGMYGGSYGGFMTLMALFTQPGKIKAGAALRPVTDWAHYNHGYTSNILNEPFTDSIAYRRSSPIYFANGLQDHLLICHGMMDVNVHFQDVVRLTQRLIELGKNNWQLAPYPMEDHGFVEPSSWTDEYKRIYKLFAEKLAETP